MISILNFTINKYPVYAFFWDVFLALIPCLITYRLSKKEGLLKKWPVMGRSSKVFLMISFLVWLFFFPNAAYLMANIRHLVDYCQDPGFFRSCSEQAYIVPIFFTYALMGIPTFYYALSKMAYIMGKLFGKRTQLFFPILIIPITTIGIMLGLFARFNSWDIIRHPLSIIKVAGAYLTDTVMLMNFVSYTLMLYLIYYFVKLVTRK